MFRDLSYMAGPIKKKTKHILNFNYTIMTLRSNFYEKRLYKQLIAARKLLAEVLDHSRNHGDYTGSSIAFNCKVQGYLDIDDIHDYIKSLELSDESKQELIEKWDQAEIDHEFWGNLELEADSYFSSITYGDTGDKEFDQAASHIERDYPKQFGRSGGWIGLYDASIIDEWYSKIDFVLDHYFDGPDTIVLDYAKGHLDWNHTGPVTRNDWWDGLYNEIDLDVDNQRYDQAQLWSEYTEVGQALLYLIQDGEKQVSFLDRDWLAEVVKFRVDDDAYDLA